MEEVEGGRGRDEGGSGESSRIEANVVEEKVSRKGHRLTQRRREQPEEEEEDDEEKEEGEEWVRNKGLFSCTSRES